MEELIVMVIFGVFLVGTIMLVRFSLALGRKKQFYQALSGRYGGNVVTRMFRPRMWFRYGSSMGYLKSSRNRAHGEQTVLILTWPDKRMRFDIATKDLLVRSGRQLETVPASELEFDLDLLIKTNDLTEMRQLMSQGVRWKVTQLANHMMLQTVRVNLWGGKLTITKPGKIKTFQQLDDLVPLGLELHDQMVLTKSEGIDFVDSAQAKILEDVKCPICSEDVIEDMVICLRCKTPHCRDCWQYNGHCATFACNETRYFQAGSSTRSRD